MRLSLRTRHRHLVIATGEDVPAVEEPADLSINVGLANFDPAPGVEVEIEPAEARFGFTRNSRS